MGSFGDDVIQAVMCYCHREMPHWVLARYGKIDGKMSALFMVWGEGMSCKLKAQKDKQEKKGGKAKKFFGQKDDESSK